MTKTYRMNVGPRLANAVFRQLTQRGLGAGYRHILTANDRTTGKPRSTPVDVMRVDNYQWLVAPYGVVNWVRNVRVTPEITIRRGRDVEQLRAVEASAAEAVPVIRAYLQDVPVTLPYWNVTVEASDAQIDRDAATHPVFRLDPIPA